jgi:superfamily II DNA or RNA helicase
MDTKAGRLMSSRADWQIGEAVRVRGARWTIRGTEAWPDCSLLHLSSSRVLERSRTLLTPFDRPVRTPVAERARRIGPRRWLHAVRRFEASLVPFGGARTAASASLRLLPHQFEPLLSVLRHGTTRLLIADDVGLGKTIQAGLVLSELAARADGFRALVLVPASLRDQWARELEEHFSVVPSVADAHWLRGTARDWPPDVNPWSLPGTYLTSIDFVKQPEVLRAIEQTTWDLVILDEAHTSSSASERRAAAHALASRGRRVVLLTATPDIGDANRFGALCSIGQLDPDEPPLGFFRRTRAELGEGQARRSTFVRVRPTRSEQRMHLLLERYTRRVWKEAVTRRDAAARLVAMLLCKRALSSARSLAVSVRRRLDLLARAPSPPGNQLLLPLDDEDGQPEDDVRDEELGAPGLADAAVERRLLERIRQAAEAASVGESKIARLLRWLARIPEPVIVFTEFRDTLEQLERELQRVGRTVVCLHGGMDRVDRSRAQSRFHAGGAVLLATDAAAEGLNLHYRCRIVLHFELPWRPARLQQRAGRVDRLGQTRRVREIALIGEAGAERLVLLPLALHAARGRAAGESTGLLESLTEIDVARLVHESGTGPLDIRALRGPPIPERTNLHQEATAEVERLERLRAPDLLPSSLDSVARTAPLLTWRRRSAAMDGAFAVAVFRLALSRSDGTIEHEESLVVQMKGRMKAGWRTASELRSLLQDVEAEANDRESAIGSVVQAQVDAVVNRVAPLWRASRQRLRRRIEQMRALPEASRRIAQVGLFDRRAVRALDQLAARRRDRLLELDVDMQSLADQDEVRASVEVVGLMAVGRGWM